MYYEKIDNVLPLELFDSLKDIHLGSKYGNKSALDDEHGHWFKDFTNERGSSFNLMDVSHLLVSPLLDVWNHLSQLPSFKDYVPVRCYVNSMTYGTDGYIHIDSVREDEVTSVIYLNEKWDPNWSGETCLFKDNEIFYSCIPKPNRAFLFDARYKHVARGLSRKCNVLRKTLIFKLRKKCLEQFERLANFLSKENANFKLLNAFQKLKDRNEEDYLCLAAPLSLSGIEISKIKQEFNNFNKLEEMIDLVSIYRSIDIKKTFKLIILSKPKIYRLDGQLDVLSKEKFLQIKKINDVNFPAGTFEIKSID